MAASSRSGFSKEDQAKIKRELTDKSIYMSPHRAKLQSFSYHK